VESSEGERVTVKYPFEEAAKMLKVVAHPIRLSIIAFLKGGRKNVTEVQEATGCKQSITSQHLSAMAEKGILGRDKIANEVFYYIRKKEVLKLLSCIKGCCDSK